MAVQVKRDRKIFYELGKKYNIPWQIIEVICVSPFKFANEKISDPIDDKTIMFAKLFKIKPKLFNFKIKYNDIESNSERSKICNSCKDK